MQRYLRAPWRQVSGDPGHSSPGRCQCVDQWSLEHWGDGKGKTNLCAVLDKAPGKGKGLGLGETHGDAGRIRQGHQREEAEGRTEMRWTDGRELLLEKGAQHVGRMHTRAGREGGMGDEASGKTESPSHADLGASVG